MASPALPQAQPRVPCWRHVCTVLAAVLLGGGLLLSSFVFGFESTPTEPGARAGHLDATSMRAAAQATPGRHTAERAEHEAGQEAGQEAEQEAGGGFLMTTAPRHQVLIEESTFNDLFEPRNVTTEIEEAILRDEQRLAEALELRQAAQSTPDTPDTPDTPEAGARAGRERRAARRRVPRPAASAASEGAGEYTVAGADVAQRGKGGCSLANLKPIKRKYCLTSVGHKRDCPQCPENARCIRQRWCCFRFVCVCEQRFSKPTFDGTELVKCSKA